MLARALSRYLNHMREAVEESRRQTAGGPVTLLAHSAGGWLARVYLLSFGTEGETDGTANVSRTASCVPNIAAFAGLL